MCRLLVVNIIMRLVKANRAFQLLVFAFVFFSDAAKIRLQLPGAIQILLKLAQGPYYSQ